MKSFAAYRVYWVNLTPTEGSPTPRDITKIKQIFTSATEQNGSIESCESSKKRMLEKLARLERVGLFKTYTANIFTDKQFKMKNPKASKQQFETMTI